MAAGTPQQTCRVHPGHYRNTGRGICVIDARSIDGLCELLCLPRARAYHS